MCFCLFVYSLPLMFIVVLFLYACYFLYSTSFFFLLSFPGLIFYLFIRLLHLHIVLSPFIAISSILPCIYHCSPLSFFPSLSFPYSFSAVPVFFSFRLFSYVTHFSSLFSFHLALPYYLSLLFLSSLLFISSILSHYFQPFSSSFTSFTIFSLVFLLISCGYSVVCF